MLFEQFRRRVKSRIPSRIPFFFADYDNSEREQRVPVPNKALARYLARSDYDDFYPSDYRKRAMYRKRGERDAMRRAISLEYDEMDEVCRAEWMRIINPVDNWIPQKPSITLKALNHTENSTIKSSANKTSF